MANHESPDLQRLIARFSHYLVVERGLASSTQATYWRELHRFFAAC
jgi:hypothetical protein